MRILFKTGYQKLLAQSEVIEQDKRGPKVLCLPDGNFLKIFRLRSLASSRVLYPEPFRFTLNAGALHRRNIPTITVLRRIFIPHFLCSGVIYRPLPGHTLRRIAADGQVDDRMIFHLGKFVARLHRQGIHFRSLHMGNVLLCPDGGFGLIDISDMTAFPWPLSIKSRIRNFRHLFRYASDLKVLTDAGIRHFLDGYLDEQPSLRMRRKVKREIDRWVS